MQSYSEGAMPVKVVASVSSILSIVLLQVLILSQVTSAQPKQQEPTADSVWEAAMAAKGGRERLHTVKSLYAMRSLPENDRDYDFYVFPSYSYVYSYGGRREDVAKVIWNDKLNCSWWLSPSGKPAQLIKDEEDDRRGMVEAQLLYLMETRWLKPTILKTEKMRVGFSKVDVVDVEAQGYQARFYLDGKTHLPYKVFFPDKRILVEGAVGEILQLADYTSVDGIMMPAKITHSFVVAPGRWKEEVKYEINPPYKEEFFYHPPTLRTQPESWRLTNTTTSALP